MKHSLSSCIRAAEHDPHDSQNQRKGQRRGQSQGIIDRASERVDAKRDSHAQKEQGGEELESFGRGMSHLHEPSAIAALAA